MDPISVTGWLERIGQWIVAPIVAALATAFLVTWFQDRRRVRAEHLEAIKKGVLTPLLERLGSQLSVLRQKAPPVVADRGVIASENTRPWVAAGSPRRYQEVLLVAPVLGIPLQGELQSEWRLEAPSLASRFISGDPEFYACTKRSHSSEVIREFEALEVSVGEHGHRCLRLAEQLQDRLRARAPIPESVPQESPTHPLVRTAHLALHILNHRLGVDRSPLTLDGHGKTLTNSRGDVVGRGEPDELRACLALVEELLSDDGEAATLLEEARTLASQLVQMERKIERKLREPRLAGRCRYVRISWRPKWWPFGRQ